MLNEFDLEDFDILPKVPLSDVPKNSYIKVFGDIFKYLYIDGIHAECEDKDGRTVFMKTWTLVQPLKHKDADKPIQFKP